MSWSVSEDVSRASGIVAGAVVLAWLLWLVFEARSRERQRGVVLLSGFVAALLCLLAVLRPARVLTRGTKVGSRVAVIVDASRRMLLQANGGTRWDAALGAARALGKEWQGARLSYYALQQRQAAPVRAGLRRRRRLPDGEESDLAAALASSLRLRPSDLSRSW